MSNRTTICPYCQSELSGESQVCPNCGAPVTAAPSEPVPVTAYQPLPEKTTEPGKGTAIAGLITGIVGLFISWLPFFGMVFIVPALVLNVVAINRKPSNRGMAVAGLVLACISLFINLLLIIGFLADEGF